MLNGYSVDKNGVIKQADGNRIVYDLEYVHSRYSFNKNVPSMSCLRLGYIMSRLETGVGTLLDVGYGNGDFLRTAERAGFTVAGYDVDPAFPLEGIQRVDSLFSGPWDLVTFFDSLEHFEDIYSLRDLQARYILVSVPWCHYKSDSWFENWKHRRPGEHIWHFNEKALELFFADLGYRLIEVSAIEDAIRKGTGPQTEPNILTGLFERK